MIHLEIACFNVASMKIAQRSAADRIEFCADYDSGGVTPNVEDLRHIKSEIAIPVFVMIRPRSGEFVYSDEEFEIMKSSIQNFKEVADGFVFGILTSDGKVDLERNSELVKIAKLPCTFHRAFDEMENSEQAIEDVISCGFQNILTSGGKGNAIDNIEKLTELIRKASGRITIMPGGGIRSGNIGKLLGTTAVWFHSAALSSGKTIVADESEIKNLKSRI